MYSRTIHTNNPRYGIVKLVFNTFEGNSEVITTYTLNTVNTVKEIYKFCLVVGTLYDE